MVEHKVKAAKASPVAQLQCMPLWLLPTSNQQVIGFLPMAAAVEAALSTPGFVPGLRPIGFQLLKSSINIPSP